MKMSENLDPVQSVSEECQELVIQHFALRILSERDQQTQALFCQRPWAASQETESFYRNRRILDFRQRRDIHECETLPLCLVASVGQRTHYIVKAQYNNQQRQRWN